VSVGLWPVWVPLAERRNGQILRKRRCGLRVVSTNDDDMTWIRAVNRRLLGLSTGLGDTFRKHAAEMCDEKRGSLL